MGVHAVQQFGDGKDRIVAEVAGHGAGMAGLADADDGAMADVAADAGHGGDRDVGADQHGPLLDVQFEPGGEGRGVEQGFAACDAVDVGTGVAHGLTQGAASLGVASGGVAQVEVGLRSGGRTAPRSRI